MAVAVAAATTTKSLRQRLLSRRHPAAALAALRFVAVGRWLMVSPTALWPN